MDSPQSQATKQVEQEMPDIRRFWSRAGAKCETFLGRAGAAFGVVQARNSRHSSLSESCRREIQDIRRFCRDTAAILATFVLFGLLNENIIAITTLKERFATPLQKSPSPFQAYLS